MTQNQFHRLAENFADFAGKQVEYLAYWPSANKYIKTSGYLRGIGMGPNSQRILITYGGYTSAIHFGQVYFPKL